jgi:hypothetical protein
LFGNLRLLSQRNDISSDKLFQYPLSPIPWALIKADGCFVKTNKAQFMHVLEKEADSVDKYTSKPPTNCATVHDGNASLRGLVRLPETFGELALAVFMCLPKHRTVHFVTDSYFSGSIKEI